MDLKCNACIGEYVVALEKMPHSSYEDRDALWARVRDAATMVPSWQSMTMMGQVIFACVTLPTCREHIAKKKESAAEQALASGLMLPGGG